MRLIEITVARNGTTTIATKGYAGSECQEATRRLEAALGLKTSDAATAEMYQTAHLEQTQQQQA